MVVLGPGGYCGSQTGVSWTWVPIKLKPFSNCPCGQAKAAFLPRKNNMVHRRVSMPAQHRAHLLNSVTRVWGLLDFLLFFWRQGLGELRLGSCSSCLSTPSAGACLTLQFQFCQATLGIAELTLVSQPMSAGEAGGLSGWDSGFVNALSSHLL